MEEQKVSFEVAKLANIRGFDYNIYNRGDSDYTENGDLLNETDERYYQQVLFPAPTQNLLQKWLREVHNIDIIIAPVGNYAFVTTGYYYEIPLSKEGTNIESDSFKTYEEALEEGLKQALTLIKI